MTASSYLQTLPDTVGEDCPWWRAPVSIASFSWTCFEGSEQEVWKGQP